MRYKLAAGLLALALGLGAGAATASTGAAVDPGAQCLAGIRAAEREHRLPEGLLGAIARVESGRAHPRTGAPTPWPWTINAEGQGRYFDTKAEAIAAVQALRARGVTVIDVGCMQVNLHHHPDAFPDLEAAFDPASNAGYAARFLRRLHQSRNDWEVAAAHYHSATPERAEAYRMKVLAAWPAMAKRYAEERQRLALIGAWTGAEGATLGRANGFQVRALALTQRPALHGRESPLLDPVPAIRVVGRTTTGRTIHRVEVAEAPPRR